MCEVLVSSSMRDSMFRDSMVETFLGATVSVSVACGGQLTKCH